MHMKRSIFWSQAWLTVPSSSQQQETTLQLTRITSLGEPPDGCGLKPPDGNCKACALPLCFPIHVIYSRSTLYWTQISVSSSSWRLRAQPPTTPLCHGCGHQWWTRFPLWLHHHGRPDDPRRLSVEQLKSFLSLVSRQHNQRLCAPRQDRHTGWNMRQLFLQGKSASANLHWFPTCSVRRRLACLPKKGKQSKHTDKQTNKTPAKNPTKKNPSKVKAPFVGQ